MKLKKLVSVTSKGYPAQYLALDKIEGVRKVNGDSDTPPSVVVAMMSSTEYSFPCATDREASRLVERLLKCIEGVEEVGDE